MAWSTSTCSSWTCWIWSPSRTCWTRSTCKPDCTNRNCAQSGWLPVARCAWTVAHLSLCTLIPLHWFFGGVFEVFFCSDSSMWGWEAQDWVPKQIGYPCCSLCFRGVTPVWARDGEIAAVLPHPRPAVPTFGSPPIGGLDSVSPVRIFALAQAVLMTVKRWEKINGSQPLKAQRF